MQDDESYEEGESESFVSATEQEEEDVDEGVHPEEEGEFVTISQISISEFYSSKEFLSIKKDEKADPSSEDKTSDQSQSDSNQRVFEHVNHGIIDEENYCSEDDFYE